MGVRRNPLMFVRRNPLVQFHRKGHLIRTRTQTRCIPDADPASKS